MFTITAKRFSGLTRSADKRAVLSIWVNRKAGRLYPGYFYFGNLREIPYLRRPLEVVFDHTIDNVHAQLNSEHKDSGELEKVANR